MRALALALCAPLLGAPLWSGALSAVETPSGPKEPGEPFAHCEARLAARPDSWRALCFLHTARETGLWDAAQRRAARRLERYPDNPFLLFTLGFLELEGGELPAAAEQFRLAAESFAERGDASGEALALLNRGDCLLRQGLLEDAESTLQRAEVAARAAADLQLLVTVRVRQTKVMAELGGDLEQAQRLLLQVERELPGDARYSVRKPLFYERAVLAQRLGRTEEARRINQLWAEAARSAGQMQDEATARANEALSVVAGPLRAGVREEAIRSARAALEAAERSENRAAAVSAHLLLGKLLPGPEGRVHLESCIRLIASTGEAPRHAACLFALAGSLAATDSDRARRTLDRALTLALTSEDPWTGPYGWAERFRVRWATQPREQAAADSLAVLQQIEALRRLQSSESGRAGFFTGWVEVYHSSAGFLLDAPDGPSREEIEAAFSISERLRARVLLDSLAAARVEGPTPADDEHTAVLREIVRVQRLLQNPALEARERASVLTELETLERDLGDLDDRLHGSGSATLPEVGFVGLSELESTLDPSQAVLTLLVAPDEDVYGKFAGGSWLLAVTGSGTRVYRLPGRMELEVMVPTFLGLVETRDDAILEPGAAALYQDLLGPALADLPGSVDDLILVPDGVLHLLPFGLLRPHPRADPLAVGHRLSAAPSATLWHRWRANPVTTPAAALALADPAFVGASSVGASSVASLETPAAGERQWALETGGALGRLPHAVAEGRRLVRRLGGPPSQVRIGEEASEAFLKRAPLKDFGVLHFAVHALVDDERPGRSAVLLAAGDADQDGLLQPREIAALDLTGKLVVVSACESGSGQVLLGEGVQSLARAFFRAGARTVVASLWRLEDAEAADFFDRFYRALAQGDSVAGAVAETRRELRREGAPAAAWAGVVVLGDGGMVPLPEGVPRPGGWWLLLGLLAVLGLSVGAWRRARRA